MTQQEDIWFSGKPISATFMSHIAQTMRLLRIVQVDPAILHSGRLSGSGLSLRLQPVEAQRRNFKRTILQFDIVTAM